MSDAVRRGPGRERRGGRPRAPGSGRGRCRPRGAPRVLRVPRAIATPVRARRAGARPAHGSRGSTLGRAGHLDPGRFRPRAGRRSCLRHLRAVRPHRRGGGAVPEDSTSTTSISPGQPPIRESDTITPGEALVTHQTEFGRVGLSICYDLRFPELYRGLMAMGAEVMFVPAQFQYETGVDHWHALLRARAIEEQCFVVAPGQCGTFGDPARGRRSFGHSLIVDPRPGSSPRNPRMSPECGSPTWTSRSSGESARRSRRSSTVGSAPAADGTGAAGRSRDG